MKKFLFILFCVMNISFAYSATEDVYLLAQTNNASELQNIKDIDVVNKNGDTALCYAIKDGNVDAYNLLKNAGANTNHKCIKNIPTEQYEHFITKVASANNSWSFLGLGKWAWAGIGAGVVAGGAAAGMGGGGSGGGGGSDSESGDFSGGGNCSGGYVYNGNNECVPRDCSDYPSDTPCFGYEQLGVCQSSDGMHYKCGAPKDCSGYDYSENQGCPDGWQISSSCKSGETWFYKCDTKVICSYEYNSIECANGFVETGDTCQSGDVVYKKCIPQTCPDNYVLSCSNGFHETGYTCQSGNNTLVECKPNICGNEYQEGVCPNGYVSGDVCYEGFVEKHTCVQEPECPYNQTECSEGFHETGKKCSYQGTTYVQCEANTCNGYTTNCTSGYTEVPGDTCNSGGTIMKKCEPNACDGFDIVNANQCTGGYTIGSSCKSGNVTKYKCDQMIDCKANATWTENGCVCNEGFEAWTKGFGCHEKYCGPHAHVEGNECQCDENYENWTYTQGCTLMQLDCGANASQNGDKCVCYYGYENHVMGVGCSLKQIQCGVNAHQEGTVCVCDSGWTGNPTQGCTSHNFAITNYTNVFNNNDDADVFISSTIVRISSEDNDRDTNEPKTISLINNGNGNIASKVWQNNALTETHLFSYDFGNPYNVIASGTMYIENVGGGNIYGRYSEKDNMNEYGINYNSKLWIDSHITIGEGVNNVYTYGGSASTYNESLLKINNTGNGYIYGMYGPMLQNAGVTGDAYLYGISEKDNRPIAQGTIDIENHGNGNVYGMYDSAELSNDGSSMIYNAYSGIDSASDILSNMRVFGNIIISNDGAGDVYGMYSPYELFGTYAPLYSKVDVESLIKITNNGDGNVYGMYSDSDIIVAGGRGFDGIKIDGTIKGPGTNKIYINNFGDGNSYALYSDDIVHADGAYIKIENRGNGTSYGIYARKEVYNSDDSFSVNLHNISMGKVVGVCTKKISNRNEININNIGTGTAIGIFGESNSTITNSGKITITRNSYTDENNVVHNPAGISGDVFGIYAKTNSTVDNSGTIDITTNGTAYGIYAESGSTVTNTGTIKINGNSCTGSNCNSTNNAIVLNGSTLYNNGAIQANTLNLAPMKGKVVASAGSSFVVDNDMSGDLHIDSDVVASGNQTTYIAQNMIDAGDTSNLNLISDSAMFDVSLSGKDVVMQMKDFDTLTDNKSLAAFLKNNYDKGNGSELFSALKSMDNMSAFNGALMGLSGLDSFTQFAHEDLSALREISLSMNNKLFENSDRDNFDISDSMGYFSFSDNHNSGSGQYGISSSRLSDNWKLGYGMAMANIYTNDGDGFSRQNQMWMFYMPATYTNDDIELVITSQAGFTRGQYNRRGFNNQNYEGYIEKQIVGLMNDLRYPIIFGNWTFAPDLAFNAIMYKQSGHEDEREFGLIIPNDTMVSVETGLGLYSKYEKTFQNGGRLRFTSGIMGYREYGDTYNIKLGMRGMDGTFDLYNNDYKYRGAFNIGLDYTTGRFHLYGNTQYFMDNANYMNFKGGISYRF